MSEMLICVIIYLGTAIFMSGIGIVQIRSKVPVGFYSGEIPPKESEITDVRAWNVKHGTMWILYGVIILVSAGVSFLIGDSLWNLIPLLGGIIVPVIIMIIYHHKLCDKYLIK